MKKYILSISLLLLFPVDILWAKNNKVIKAVERILQQQQANWTEGNMEGFMQAYWQNDSLLLINGKFIVYTWQSIFDTYKEAFPDKQSMSHLLYKISTIKALSNKNAIVIGSWHRDSRENPPDGHFMLLFEKIKGKWKIVVDQTT